MPSPPEQTATAGGNSGGERLFPGLGQAILLVLAVLSVQVVYGIGISMVDFGLRRAGVGLSRPLAAQPLVLGIVNLIAFGAPLAFCIWWQRASLSTVLPIGALRPRPLILAMAATILGELVLSSEVDNFTRMLLPPPEWMVRHLSGLVDVRSTPVQSAFLLVLVAPLTEEVFFRGLILRGLLSRYSKVMAVFLTALLFAMLHLNPWQFFSAMTLGLLFGWWFVRTRALLPCLVGHALANGLVFLQFLLPFEITGFNTDPVEALPVRFQPLWFDAAGAVLLLVGLVTFHVLTRRSGSDAAGNGSDTAARATAPIPADTCNVEVRSLPGDS